MMITILGTFLKVCMTFGCYYVPINFPTMAGCIDQGKIEVAGKGATWTYTCKQIPMMVVSATGTQPCATCLTTGAPP